VTAAGCPDKAFRLERLGVRALGSSPLLAAPFHDTLARGLERLHDERFVFGREAGAQVQRPSSAKW
jgi:hypothetical protein